MKWIKLFEDYNKQVSLQSVIELIEYVYYFNYDEEDEDDLLSAMNDLKKLSTNSVNDLKKIGITKLYRGLSINDINKLKNDKLPIVSWTYNKDTAESFAEPHGIVLYEDIDNLDVIVSIKEFAKYVKSNCYKQLDDELQQMFDEYILEDNEFEVLCFSKKINTDKFYKHDSIINVTPIKESLLLEKSVYDFTEEMIFSNVYKKNMRREDVYQNQIDSYMYEEGIDNYDEINYEIYDNWFFDLLSSNYYDFSHTIDDMIQRDGTVKIWRRMTVDDDWLSQIERGNIRLGMWWSWDENAAEAHWGDSSKRNSVLIESVIKEEYVNWLDTIHANIHPALYQEKEITLYKNTTMKIVSIEMNGEMIDSKIFENKIYKA